MPHGMQESIMSMSDEDKVNFIISGFRCAYVNEWEDISEHIADFVYSMYQLHNKLLEC